MKKVYPERIPPLLFGGMSRKKKKERDLPSVPFLFLKNIFESLYFGDIVPTPLTVLCTDGGFPL